MASQPNPDRRRRHEEALEWTLLLRLALRQGPHLVRPRLPTLLRPPLLAPYSLPPIPLCLPPHHVSRVDKK
ncbi:hypothetical protein ACOSQ3_025976 [Xanthoceras sorbifolium]